MYKNEIVHVANGRIKEPYVIYGTERVLEQDGQRKVRVSTKNAASSSSRKAKPQQFNPAYSESFQSEFQPYTNQREAGCA
jgi:hypothetical protein